MGLAVRRRALAVSIVVVACAVTKPMAGSTPALGDWPDQQSVYQTAAVRPVESTSAYGSQEDFGQRASDLATSADAPTPDPFVVPAMAALPVDSEPDVPMNRDPRKLLLPKHATDRLPTEHDGPASHRQMPEFGLPFESLYTTGAALAIVVGLFLVCALLVRRGTRKPSTALPDGVVSVLGRVPLANRQSAELVRVGNKLVLLAVTQGGIEPLTEISDPTEIDRVLGLCAQQGPHSSSSEFDVVFRQLAAETAPDDFTAHEPITRPSRPAAEAYAALRGGASRG